MIGDKSGLCCIRSNAGDQLSLATQLALSKISGVMGHSAVLFLRVINLISSPEGKFIVHLPVYLVWQAHCGAGYENGAKVDVQEHMVPHRDFSDAQSIRSGYYSGSR
jgi:hypothetical protein